MIIKGEVMNFRILKEYIKLCKKWNKNPTWIGIKFFKKAFK